MRSGSYAVTYGPRMWQNTNRTVSGMHILGWSFGGQPMSISCGEDAEPRHRPAPLMMTAAGAAVDDLTHHSGGADRAAVLMVGAGRRFHARRAPRVTPRRGNRRMGW
jgi:hypothetical protein